MQSDMKKLIAYSSVAHMGYVTIGIFSFSKQGIDGAIFQMISHGFISSALFLCVGVLYDRVHSRLIDTYKGIVNVMPIFSLVFLTSSLANVGLPGTSGFIGELLTLIGVFKMNYVVAIIAGLGVILSAAYMLWLCKRLIFGNFSIQGLNKNEKLLDMNLIEKVMIFSLIILIILVGVYPNIILDTISTSVDQTLSSINKQISIKKAFIY
jgi:NADH-quinone oxidoreductase subunit M